MSAIEVILTAISNSPAGGPAQISTMTYRGTRTVYDPDDDPPAAVGDVVRITGTGLLGSTGAGATSVTFRLLLPDSAPMPLSSVTATLPDSVGSNVPLFFQFLLTFRAIDQADATVETNGMIILGNAFTKNMSTSTAAVNLDVEAIANVDVFAVTTGPATVKFDQCIIEYLWVPSPPPESSSSSSSSAGG